MPLRTVEESFSKNNSFMDVKIDLSGRRVGMLHTKSVAIQEEETERMSGIPLEMMIDIARFILKEAGENVT